MALGLACATVSALLAGAGVIFCALAAYLSLIPYLDPRGAALAIGGAGLLLALAVGLIGQMIARKLAERLVAWVKSSAVVVLAPHVLGFAARHAKLFGLASAAGAAYFAARSNRAD
ncbi:hypothetical protein CCR94_15685 [Rhodoblastus sphagnicola]|uniref:Uncharacterized protein n=2 Tax=Rhodoblastus sphagnicola TaxID=333368 RepID=A0A2S6N3R6_9HYPH|nr:hypothetical protein CCR94_15685 [Rhodoblastus sphagnicola]